MMEIEYSRSVSIAAMDTNRIQEVTEEDREQSGYSLSSEDTDNCSNTEMEFTIPECRDKGKSKVNVVEGSDDEEYSVVSLSSENTETDLESSDEELESDCSDCEQSSNIDGSYAPDNEDTPHVKPNVSNRKRKGVIRKEKPKIKNPETYLDNPENVYFETCLKNRLYELLVPAEVIKDYCLRFGDNIDYIDKFGKLKATTAKRNDQRVCIRNWTCIRKRNKLKKEDRNLC